MFKAETIEIVIGLVFFYLLLSLLMTTINELISSVCSLRGRQMRKAVAEMLGKDHGNLFFNHPLIGELGTSRWKLIRYFQDNIPSYMRASAFSQVVVDIIKQEIATKRKVALALLPVSIQRSDAESKIADREPATPTPEEIQQMTLAQLNAFIQEQNHDPTREAAVQNSLQAGESAPFSEAVNIALLQLEETIKSMGFPEKTMSIILNLAKSVDGDIDLFKKKLEEWFDAKMERVTGWFVRQMRWITLAGALVIAIAFNADTFFIVQKLATDSEARAAIVASATAYVAKNTSTEHAESGSPEISTSQPPADTNTTSNGIANPPNDPLASTPTPGIHNALQDSIDKADSLALVSVVDNIKRADKLIQQDIKFASQTLGLGWNKLSSATNPDYCDCQHGIWCYLKKFFGWLITAIAISLGAPFWFDLLKKLVSIRSAGINPDEIAKADKKPVG